MDVPLAIMSETLAAAGNLNRTAGSRARRPGESIIIPQIVVFRSAVFRWLLVASVSVMLLCVIGLSCQIGIVIQSKRLITATLGAVLFIWTMILMLLNAKWILILSRNRMEMYNHSDCHFQCIILSEIFLVGVQSKKGQEHRWNVPGVVFPWPYALNHTAFGRKQSRRQLIW